MEDELQRYLMSNIVGVTTTDLAQMGTTQANGGIQPQTGKRVLQPETVNAVLSAMVTAGMYEDSGRWWTEVGVPAKSGVSGAVLAVVPGWGGDLSLFTSPRHGRQKCTCGCGNKGTRADLVAALLRSTHRYR